MSFKRNRRNDGLSVNIIPSLPSVRKGLADAILGADYVTPRVKVKQPKIPGIATRGGPPDNVVLEIRRLFEQVHLNDLQISTYLLEKHGIRMTVGTIHAYTAYDRRIHLDPKPNAEPYL